jgi:hypothetical protein
VPIVHVPAKAPDLAQVTAAVNIAVVRETDPKKLEAFASALLTMNLPGYSGLADQLQAKASALTFKPGAGKGTPTGYVEKGWQPGKGGKPGHYSTKVVAETVKEYEQQIAQYKSDLNPAPGGFSPPTGKERVRIQALLAAAQKGLAEAQARAGIKPSKASSSSSSSSSKGSKK